MIPVKYREKEAGFLKKADVPYRVSEYLTAWNRENRVGMGGSSVSFGAMCDEDARTIRCVQERASFAPVKPQVFPSVCP